MATPAPPFDLTLHIGSSKTGTSSLQGFLNQNRDELLRRGWLYPRSPGATRHRRFGMMLMPDQQLVSHRLWKRGKNDDVAAFRSQTAARLLDEVSTGAGHVLLSDEGLFTARPGAIDRARALFAGRARSVRVVAYLRRQDDHLLSSYQQAVKIGSTVRLSEWAAKDRGRLYDYAARLDAWRTGMRPDAVVVRPFERARFRGGSLYQDFLDAVGVPVEVGDLAVPVDRNESLGAEAVEVLRVINLFRVEEQGMAQWRIDNGPLIPLLAAEAGEPLSLPADRRAAYLAGFEETNRIVAERYLEAADRPLFTAAVKESTEPEHRLDPARLDHYLPLLGLPEAEWAGIRRIAEREVART
ncbi:hypothetical protein E8D34_07525 [Nocardioides sp. GY 10113]|uniref:hypothetical protein n=1 Tax=Nocardioides sp. GY 10113 TaxID=2569761 RepID=UPI0010A8B4EA|nr:hypothetical protein [Nocardioides sp. GY 10113]TIC88125.1 hypothetical protein E8D34_07525 [Nocardioides sp. GY 10113]